MPEGEPGTELLKHLRAAPELAEQLGDSTATSGAPRAQRLPAALGKRRRLTASDRAGVSRPIRSWVSSHPLAKAALQFWMATIPSYTLCLVLGLCSTFTQEKNCCDLRLYRWAKTKSGFCCKGQKSAGNVPGRLRPLKNGCAGSSSSRNLSGVHPGRETINNASHKAAATRGPFVRSGALARLPCGALQRLKMAAPPCVNHVTLRPPWPAQAGHRNRLLAGL